MAKVAELLIELRAGTATLTKDLAKGESQFRRSGEASAREVARTQQRIRQIIERGEPLLAARRAAMAELAVLREGQKEGLISAERYEAARTKILSDYLERRAQLRRREAREEAAAPAAPSVASPESIFGAATANSTNIDDIYKKLTWAGERMEGVRSTMFALGVETNSAADAMSMFASQMVKGAGKATLIGFALAGAGAAIAQVMQHLEEMDRLEKQMGALSAAFGITERDVRMVTNELEKFTGELDRATVQAIIRAGSEAGLTASEIAGMGEEIKRLMDLSGADAVEAATQAANKAAERRAQSLLEQARKANEALEQQLFGAPLSEQLQRAAEQRQRDLARLSNEIRMAERNAARIQNEEERQRAEDSIRAMRLTREQMRREIRELESEAARAAGLAEVQKGEQEAAEELRRIAEQERREEQAREKRRREEEAERKRQEQEQRNARERLDEAFRDMERSSVARIRALERERDAALQTAEVAKASAEEIARVERYYIDQIAQAEEEERQRKLREEERLRKQLIAQAKREADERKRLAEEAERARREANQAAFATLGEVQGWFGFGQQLMGAFMDGAMSEAERRRKQQQSAIGGVLGGVLGMAFGFAFGNPLQGAQMGAGLGQTIGSMFADGGLVGGVGTDRSDSNLVRVSKGEYIVNARATRMALPLLEAINNGRVGAALPSFVDSGLVGGGGMGGGGAAVIEYHDNRSFAAFDPRSMYEAAGVTLAPALYRRTANRADAKLTSIQQRALRAPRLGRSIG